MSNQTKTQTLKGFRDFLPQEKRKRDYVTKKIVEIFKRFAFEPLETPTLEYATLLLGKYGIESDKLVYTFEDKGKRAVGLRYDQTVPSARVLAQYQQTLPNPFRRYQIQNVFRAEKQQKGRYREFTQCDIDIFGSKDPLSDAEIVACTYSVYKNIGFPTVQLKMNDRVTLIDTLSPYATETITVFSIIQSVDKLDKIGIDGVIEELVIKGLKQETAERVLPKIQSASISPNLSKIIEFSKKLGIPEESLIFTPTLARGLDYYTGMIFEVIVPEYGSGSLAGGGRYDNLIEQLGGVNIPATGIAYGFDRTVEAADELGLIPDFESTAQVLVTIFNEELLDESLKTAQQLREQGINTEVYSDTSAKLGKQFKYADKKKIPYVIVIGPEEKEKRVVKIKDMKTREETELTPSEIAKEIT